MRNKPFRAVLSYFWPILGVVLTVLLFKFMVHNVSNVTVALTFVIVVVFCATFLGFGPSLLASITGSLCFNLFFLPPIGVFRIDRPQDIVAFSVLTGTALIVSSLSATIKRQAQEAQRRSDEVEKLYKLAKTLIETPDTLAGTVSIADRIVSIFGLDYCGIHIPDSKGLWRHVSLSSDYPPEARMPQIKNLQKSTLDGINEEMSRGGVRYSLLKTPKRTIGMIALKARTISEDTISAITSLIALTLERNRVIRKR